jgi:hypothetical protein
MTADIEFLAVLSQLILQILFLSAGAIIAVLVAVLIIWLFGGYRG